jgi:hypothetical protein
MTLDFPLIQLFRSIISKLFRQGFFELIIVKPTIWRRYGEAHSISTLKNGFIGFQNSAVPLGCMGKKLFCQL